MPMLSTTWTLEGPATTAFSESISGWVHRVVVTTSADITPPTDITLSNEATGQVIVLLEDVAEDNGVNFYPRHTVQDKGNADITDSAERFYVDNTRIRLVATPLTGSIELTVHWVLD